MNIDNLERQHLEINSLFSKINKNLNSNNITNDIDSLVWDINTLAGKLNIHMKTEDKFLYPELINGANENLKKIALEYSQEMGNIHKVFEEFKSNFNTKNKILNDIDKFLIESNKVLKLLKNRIDKEDRSLYPKMKLI
ncbi:hemerythrin HHE cation binding domain-containing protein [Clostridium sartagoforme AAU1]|jgi:hemerythrin-like domain-containing protein|uniref:Hemerythrin HHE cation binding domain-containing protein n=1 Tax=Clostridium sartagoforme AAU1 TaxID=1202534 RepID=R9C604_9CLOT|nr:hemerythrin domain-containing protein [Clostridium sartagoforme]EOR24415.1 hemerythrin HHE cation binding domain-containing protein [Clostridium sartagoforme AAU1]